MITWGGARLQFPMRLASYHFVLHGLLNLRVFCFVRLFGRFAASPYCRQDGDRFGHECGSSSL